MSKVKEEEIPQEEPINLVEQPPIEAAFVIAIGENGQVYLERNVDATRFEVKREATMIEVRRYISEILMDLQAQAAGEYTLTALMAAQNKVVDPQ